MNQRLPKHCRIRSSREIRQILTEGRKHTGKHLILYCLESNAHETRPQAGFLSPRKLGKAVLRNRIRRHMREIFRKQAPELSSSQKILMMGRPSSIHATYLALNEEFRDLCRKARLLPS